MHLTLQHGREAECARYLKTQLRPEMWAILAALAAEVVAVHESAAMGTTLVLTPNEAELAALGRIGLAAPDTRAARAARLLPVSLGAKDSG